MTHPVSSTELLVEHVLPAQVASVFPLMRAANPGLSLATWQRFARRASRAGASAPEGVLIVRRACATHPSGAVCYRRSQDLQLGTLLTAEHFIALDLLYPDVILRALIAGLEPVAQRLGCTSIRSIVHGAAAPLIETLRLEGHLAEAVTLTKRVSKEGWGERAAPPKPPVTN